MSGPVDIVLSWFGDTPGSPRFAQPFKNVSEPIRDFGAPSTTGKPLDAVAVAITSGGSVQTPANGTIRYVPKLDMPQTKSAFAAVWPDLHLLDGSIYGVDTVPEGTVLFEIWPSAFRRLEVMVSANEGPTSTDKSAFPQTPVPRWFEFQGIAKAEIEARVNDIVASTFSSTKDMTSFFAGTTTVYVPFATPLSTAFGTTVEVRAFDSTGLIIDPVVFCAYLAELASDVFAPFAATGTEMFPFKPLKKRSTIVFSDHRGTPYVPWEEPPSWPPLPSVPLRKYTINSTTADIPESGVVSITGVTNTTAAISVDGDHTRVSLHPHGKLDKTTQAWFGEWNFLRVRVVDYQKWFPLNTNPKNVFAPYSEKNDVVPLVHGMEAFREMYRAFRSTYRQETYLDDRDMPAGNPIPSTAASQIFLTGLKIGPDTPMLGMRSLLTTPRTQTGAVGNPFASVALIPAATRQVMPDGTAIAAEQPRWWIVGQKGSVPPGTCIWCAPLGVSTSFFADDPRIPGTDSGADLYGITITSAAIIQVFANSDGSFFLPVNYATTWDRQADVRVITWEPDKDDPAPLATENAGRGQKKVKALGTITLPGPSSLVAGPHDAFFDPKNFVLSNNGAGNGATLSITTGAVTTSKTLTIVNQRSGDYLQASISPNPSGPVTIQIPSFYSADTALVGEAPSNDPTGAAFFLPVLMSSEQRATGQIAAHPKEFIGVIREAIDAGVEVRLLVDPDKITELTKPGENLTGNPGTVAAMNATINGKHGEAIADPVSRATSAHHQKASFVRSPVGVVAFVGGIDHVPTRWAGETHDEVDPDRPTSTLWHDIHCLIRGRAAWDVFANFRQRWQVAKSDPAVSSEGVSYTDVDDVSLSTMNDPGVTFNEGTHTVQINRTLPPLLPALFTLVDTEQGDLSIRESYRRMIANARHYLYIEEQYFYNVDLASRINQRLKDDGLAFVVLLLPKELSEEKILDLMLYAIRRRAINMLLYGKEDIEDGEDVTTLPGNVADRVVVAHIKNDHDDPVYIHAKTVIADDLWMSIGSSNINRRSMTYDSELNAASIDERIRRGGHVTPRQLRVRLAAEHLGLDRIEWPYVEDPRAAFELFRAATTTPPPWLADRHHLINYDPRFTNYGLQPPGSSQDFVQAVDWIIDNDGTYPDQLTWEQVIALKYALSSAPADLPSTATFGGLGTFSVTFDVSGVTTGTPDHVDVQVVEQIIDGKTVTFGPLAVNQPATLGVHKIGNNYEITAQLFDSSNAQLGSAATTVPANASVNHVILTF
jgi:phosphatidylserine/phosphatidylglycerophosphate/cardiolipin synthase-like enzyme